MSRISENTKLIQADMAALNKHKLGIPFWLTTDDAKRAGDGPLHVPCHFEISLLSKWQPFSDRVTALVPCQQVLHASWWHSANKRYKIVVIDAWPT